MKLEKINEVYQCAVMGKAEVLFSLEKEEITELNRALELVDKYKKAAVEALSNKRKYSPQESDWCSIDYSLSKNRLTVEVKDGMAG